MCDDDDNNNNNVILYCDKPIITAKTALFNRRDRVFIDRQKKAGHRGSLDP
jgi:tRNA U55 pseudouridine synthase TruB